MAEDGVTGSGRQDGFLPFQERPPVHDLGAVGDGFVYRAADGSRVLACGDCRTLVESVVSDGSVDLVITDPPPMESVGIVSTSTTIGRKIMWWGRISRFQPASTKSSRRSG